MKGILGREIRASILLVEGYPIKQMEDPYFSDLEIGVHQNQLSMRSAGFGLRSGRMCMGESVCTGWADFVVCLPVCLSCCNRSGFLPLAVEGHGGGARA